MLDSDTRVQGGADNVIHATIRAKASEIVAWLRPRKKKSIFAWENNSDDEDDMSGQIYASRKEEEHYHRANIKLHICFRESG